MRRTWTSKYLQGHPAPAFETITYEGKALTSDHLKGRKYILFFYNHDGSDTCTKEACNIRDHFHQLSGLGFEIIGVSEDSIKKHQKFIAKYALPYTLVTDPQNALARIFDIYGTKDFMGRTSDAVHRTTFVIDEFGQIMSVIHPVDSAHHAQQIIDSIPNT